jgi:hypothetical protein
MKLIQSWLPHGVAVATLLVIGPTDDVLFKPAEGLSLKRTFESKNEMVLDDMTITMSGQPFPSPEMEMTMRMNGTIVVADAFESVKEGKPVLMKRRFDTIKSTAAVNMESPMMPQGIDTTIDSLSELEGKTVVFKWNADEQAFDKSFPDDGGDAKLLEGLEQDMDFTALLPTASVSTGDTWKLELESLPRLLVPGGNLSLEPEIEDLPEGLGGMGGMEGMTGNLADMLGDLEGEATAEYKGTRDADGVKCAVIQVKLAIKSAADLSDKVAEALEDQELPEGMKMELGHMDVEMELEGEGTLLWDLEHGHAHSFDMAATVTSTMDMGMSIDAGAGQMEMEQVMEMSGSMDVKVTVSRE